MTTTERLVSLASATGFSAQARDFAAVAEPAVRFRVSEAPLPVRGESKLGGSPALSADSRWPRAQLYDKPDEPMTFIGQIEISQHLQEMLPIWPIESDGLLSFFCLKDDRTDEILGPAAVLRTPARERLLKREPPEDLPGGNRLGELAIRPHSVLTLPDIGSEKFGELEVEDHGAYRKLVAALVGEYPLHRLLGHPTILQTDVLSAAAWVGERTLDLGIGDHSWKLLLQVDHDYDRLGVGFGDGGILYFCIPEGDLASGRLDRVVALAQSQ